MTRWRISTVAALAMLAFASNSLLCRLALTGSAIDPASFTSIRLISGSVMLWFVLRWRTGSDTGSGNWWSALALFAYAAGFSFAYSTLSAGTGALLLFGAVQATMIGYGIARGERLRLCQVVGFCLALTGLVILLLPSASTPPVMGSSLMLGAGMAWGIYSIRGRKSGDPAKTTADNFLRSVPFALTMSAIMLPSLSCDVYGALLAALSGALASGIGYVIWYTALKELPVTHASAAQLSVPVLAALGGVLLIGEPFTVRLALSGALVLGGIGLVTLQRQRSS